MRMLVSSQNNDRDGLYYQQQTVSAEGFSGQAFSTFVSTRFAAKNERLHRLPRLARHDNNAWMAQLLSKYELHDFMGGTFS